MDPYTRSEIQATLLAQLTRLRAFYSQLSEDVFFKRPPVGWSPAGNVRHLINATVALLIGLYVPRLFLRILFGKNDQPSRRTSLIRDEYLAHLDAGATAGLYTPLPVPRVRSAGQERLLNRLEKISLYLSRRLESFSEEELDRLRLPHPILGRRSIREMLLFQILHNEHHTGKVRARQPKG